MAAGMKADRAAPFELKGRMSTLTVLRLLDGDPGVVLAGVEERVAMAPAMFTGLPVAIDAGGLPTLPEESGLRRLADGLREQGLVPVALVGDIDRALAARVGLGVIAEPGSGPRPAAEPAAETEAEAAPAAARVITQPVRSGQQVYARGGDLVVLASVSPGAEVLADGHVHIYGALNGRALAGVQGDETARIFCRRLNAELIAIAGRYQVSDGLSDDYLGRDVQIALRDDALTIEPMPAVG